MGKDIKQIALPSGKGFEDEPQILAERILAKPVSSTNSGVFIDQPELLRRVPWSRRSLFDYRRKGKIPAIQLGRKLLFHWPSIEAALIREMK
jgi:hypothetical protein